MAEDTIVGFEDLVKQQSLPTEEKIPQAELQPVPETVETVEEKPTKAAETATQEVETVTPVVVDEETLNVELDIALMFIDVAQSSALAMPVNSKRKKRLSKLIGENAIEKIELLIEKPTEDLTPEEAAAVKFETQAQKVLKQLPFTEEEKNNIKPLLLNYMRANRGKLPENFFVYLGILQAFGGRILNVITL